MLRCPRLLHPLCLLVAGLVALATGSVAARQGAPPYSLAHPAKAGFNLPIEDVPGIDAAQRLKDADRAARARGMQAKRLPVAAARAVSIGTAAHGRWDTLADGSRLWRVQVRASGATDLRLGFGRYALPRGATLHVIGANGYYQGPYTAADATADQFRAPVVPGDTATVELRVPSGVTLAADALELTSVGAGFRDLFGRKQAKDSGPGASGPCNVDVVCPLGQPYADEIRAVGYYEFQAADDSQYYICSGTLVADVPHDRRNWFLTAAHCMSTASETASMVVYWNYQSTRCDLLAAPPGGFLNDNQQGATLRATRADVDVTLVELSQGPDPAWNLYYAGWDATGATPPGTIGIHHPSGDVKKITAGPAPTSVPNCIADSPSGITHWQTGPYTQGTTEGGSSGSGLFVVAGNGGGHDRLLIGTLSGGAAACSATSPGSPNNDVDCYGKFSVAWNGPAAGSRLRDWLDPAGTGATLAIGVDQNAPPVLRGHSTHAIPALRAQRSPALR